MAQYEVLVLDGLTITGDPTGTLVLEAFNAPPPNSRPEWITAADSEGASLARAPQHENREITLRVRVAQQASMNAALDQVGALVDKLAKADNTPDGVAMTWTPANSTRTVTFDVLEGQITDLPIGWNGDDVGWFLNRPVMNVRLTCKPYWRGTETTTTTAATSTPFVTLEVANVPGDIPALGRLIVTDLATQSRRHVEWGVEGLYYNSATSLLVDSDNMTTTGFSGTQTTRTGAYDPNATGNNVIRTTLYSPTAVCCGTGVLNHVGTFRVKARVWASSMDVRVRLSWQYGDGGFAANAYVMPAQSGYWSEVDLGVVTIPKATSGTQRWSGRVEAFSATNADTIDVDYLILVPATEGYGKARASYQYQPGAIVGMDDYQSITAGAALSTRTATLGGTWATSGATTDFVGDATFGKTVTRNTAGDTGTGRLAILGATNYTDTEVQSLVLGTIASSSVTSGAANLGLIARYVDASNYLMAYLIWSPTPRLNVVRVQAGVSTLIGQAVVGTLSATWWRLRLVVWATGYGFFRLEGANGDVRNVAPFGDTTVLATGGVLATGKPGFVDYGNVAPAFSRHYDVFGASTPAPEPIVMYSGRQLEVRASETVRQDSTGTYYARPPSYRGTRFLVPTGTSRVLAKARRNDIDAGTDEIVTDSTQVQVAYTPRGLVVPR